MDALSVDLPMPTFVWTDAAEEAGGFQVCEMLFNGFRGYSYSFGQRSGAERTVL